MTHFSSQLLLSIEMYDQITRTVTGKIRNPGTNNHIQPCFVQKTHDTGNLSYKRICALDRIWHVASLNGVYSIQPAVQPFVQTVPSCIHSFILSSWSRRRFSRGTARRATIIIYLLATGLMSAITVTLQLHITLTCSGLVVPAQVVSALLRGNWHDFN